ncbi:MAG: class I SAM-dependent methyltransferase [Hyphomicrobiaceae bacterium]|nr:MAG: class I SAM-dependent methyltransferase [Hyphomicrobiaceae bacterium]
MNKSALDTDGYVYVPSLYASPYTKANRYQNPKENYKHVARRLTGSPFKDRACSVIDAACGNGELLYHLRGNFPNWQLYGVDFTEAFIDVAKNYEGLKGVRFEHKDLFDVNETFDIVICTGLITTFWEPESLLDKLLGLCRSGGRVLVDGCFNKHDIEVRCIYMDNSNPDLRGKWRRDWSQHSRSGLRELLKGKCKTVEFDDIVMGVDIPRSAAKPQTHVWTFRDAEGKNLITNGTNILLNASLMVIEK